MSGLRVWHGNCTLAAHLAAGGSVTLRFAGKQGQPDELASPTAGLADALALAADFR